MYKARKLIICLAILLVAAFALTACGTANNAAGTETASNTSTAGSSNVLKVGIDDTYPPMEYKDDSGANAGFDIEVAQAIGEKMGKKVEFVPTAWTAIFSALEAEKYDCIISSLSITDERKKTIAYTKPYIANNQVIVVKAGTTDVKSEKDLKGKIVCVQMGTTSDDACKEFNKVTPFKEYKQYEAMTEALNELKIGRVDALVADVVVAKYFVAKDSKSYTVVDTTLPKEPIGVGCKKSNDKLAGEIDKALDDMRADGTLKKISEKWFGEDMTANIQ